MENISYLENVKLSVDTKYNIFVEAKSSYLYSLFFYQNSWARPELQDLINPQFQFISLSLYKHFIIELDKLLSESKKSKNSIHNLLELIDRPEGVTLGFTNEIINEWKTKMTGIARERDIIKTLRDKHYAHTDNIYQSDGVKYLSVDEIDRVFEVVEAIVVHAFEIAANSKLIVDFRFKKNELISEIKLLGSTL